MQPCVLEHAITELHYLWPYLHTVQPVCLPRVFLRCNKTGLIASNDKADTPVADAIVKSGFINQTAVRQGYMYVMTGKIGDERLEWWRRVG